jgi:hypothetical protein
VDDGTAFNLIGQTTSLMIDGRRVDGVMVTGNQVSTSGPGYIDLLLPTAIGEPERRIRVQVDKVELAQP